ncbi:MAG: alpha/beta fold hydrolase [Gemmataceae bacterium]
MDDLREMPVAEINEFRSSDGYTWKYRSYSPPSEVRGHVVCLHGIQSHSLWYEGSCQRMAGEGFAVSFLDRRGSGINEQARGDTPSFRRLLDDVAEFVRPLRSTGAPVILLAISWGGKLAVGFQRRHPGLIDGMILVAPGFCPRVQPSFAEKVKIAWSSLVRPGRHFPIPLNDPELFTTNAERLQFLREDPLALHEATGRFLAQSTRLDWYLPWAKKRVNIPVLLMLAEHDRIIDNDRTRKFVGGFATEDVTILEYPGAHHTLEFEPDPSFVFDDLSEWLDAHVPASKKTTKT